MSNHTNHHPELHISLVDHFNLLSKHQTQRIKTAIRTHPSSAKIFRSIDAKIALNAFLKHHIIPSISYPGTVDPGSRYNHCEMTLHPESRLCTIELFVLDTPPRVAHEKKLRQLLKEQGEDRKVSGANPDHDKMRTYHRLKRLLRRDDLPTPNDIHTNAAMYEELIKSLPKSPVRAYFEMCL